MKIMQTASILAIAAVLGATNVALADSGTSTFGASVSVLSPDQTGFLIGGQVVVGGLGSGALTLSRSVAEMSLTGSANSALTYETGDLMGVESQATVESTMTFDRDITTSGSLVGTGSVVSRGEAIAAIGSAGSASANTETAGTETLGGEGSATSEATSQGSLNGSLSTTNTLQLLGTSGLFAGSNGLTVGETNTALAYGSSDVQSDGVTGIDLSTAAVDGDLDLLHGTGEGALFNVTSALNGGDIDLSVSNAGNGTVSITTSTGGFFTGGGAAGGAATFVDNGSFFGADI